MDISSVGSFAGANKATKANDGDADDKGGKAGGKVAAQGAPKLGVQTSGNTNQTAPTTKLQKEDNVVNTNAPKQPGSGKISTLA